MLYWVQSSQGECFISIASRYILLIKYSHVYAQQKSHAHTQNSPVYLQERPLWSTIEFILQLLLVNRVMCKAHLRYISAAKCAMRIRKRALHICTGACNRPRMQKSHLKPMKFSKPAFVVWPHTNNTNSEGLVTLLVHTSESTGTHKWVNWYTQVSQPKSKYGVATISRLLIIMSLLQNSVSFIGLFCKRDP